jgi:predicted methyltransferase MtxX (methanogen marker protein 4)
MNEGNARVRLAKMGVASRENLKIAFQLYDKVQKLIPKTSTDYARVLVNEGYARGVLAEIGIDSKKNLETAIRLCEVAREIFLKTSVDYARVLINEGSARKTLAEMGFDSRENLETAIRLYGLSQEIFSKTSVDYACALMNEGNARELLAEMGIDSRENLEIAVNLCEATLEISPKTSVDYACALMNEGTARTILAEINVDSQKNFERSQKLYSESISLFEGLGDGWTYSLALLNLNSLLQNKFYKTGDKKYLEEWERNLDDIEEKIKDRDIRYKEILMARIHEIRANLFELEGKSGINKASREYYEAYKLSKYPFYKFMDEFCQARIDTTSFCELVSDWNEIEKEGIFLNYYDYTVFECHLENALKRSIFRKDELELARQKLEEMGNRKQIKIMTDRVSAYIFLINSLDFCFEQGSYEDAAENVQKSYKIFHEFGDKLNKRQY